MLAFEFLLNMMMTTRKWRTLEMGEPRKKQGGKRNMKEFL
jgi:hypothetical protein